MAWAGAGVAGLSRCPAGLETGMAIDLRTGHEFTPTRHGIRRALGLAVSAFTLAALLVESGCGGGSSSPVQKGPSNPSPQECVSSTVAKYIGTSCALGATVYNWQSYSCTSTPSSICDSLGANGANLAMARDPQGPYTLLVGETNLWNVSAGQTVDVVISGTLYGATRNNNWPHFNGLKGQTGDGTEDNTTTVNCASSGACTNSLNGVSDDPCDVNHPDNCVDLPMIPSAIDASFTAATSSNPYTLTVEIKLNGGTSGTATLYSVGLHLLPVQ
jgi:hypothetical protein